MRKIAFYGGSFDPPHCGHLTIARKLGEQFKLDEFVFVPAFHAPHKRDKNPTSAFHRYAMLALATNEQAEISISKLELEAPERPYTFETLERLKNELPSADIFFVMGADSWVDITTWREWEKVLTSVNIVVITRPDYEIGFSHVTAEIRRRIVDLRGGKEVDSIAGDLKIYISDAVNIDVSATEIRQKIRADENDWRELTSGEVARYIEKYKLYK